MEKRRYQDLIAWQKAMMLTRNIYELTIDFPAQEKYGISNQLRRAAISVPSNIAEGQGRLTRGEFKQFLGHARGSLFEVETQVLLARDFGYISSQQADKTISLTAEVSRLLNGLIAAL